MNPVVIGFTGKVASGKSTLSTELSQILKWPRVSFGDYVRSIARSRNMSEERNSLQELGESLVRDHCEEFCRSVLAYGNWKPNLPIILDGVRHIQVVEELKRIVEPLRFILVYLNINDLTRRSRLTKESLKHLRDIDHHPMELQVRAILPEAADLVLDGEQPLSTNIKKILLFIQ